MKFSHFHLPHVFWPHQKYSQEGVGISLAFIAVIFSGTYIAFAKGLTPYLSPLSLLLISEALTAIFVVMTIGIVPIFTALFTLDGKTIFFAALVGILSSGIAPVLWFTGLAHSSAVNAALLDGSSIIFALILSRIALGEVPNYMQRIGAVIVFFGVTISSVLPAGGMSLLPGDIAIIGGVLVFACGTILFKKYLTGMNSEVALFIRSVSGMTFACIAIAFVGHPFAEELRAFPIDVVWLLIAFVFFSKFLQLTFFYAALDRVPAVKISLINQSTPLASVFFAVIILGESFTAYHAFGAALIVSGLLIEDVSAKKFAKLIHLFAYRDDPTDAISDAPLISGAH